MDYNKIRETLIEERTENRQKIKQNEENIEKLKVLLSNIDNESLTLLRNRGVYIDNLDNIDFDKLKTDSESQLNLLSVLNSNLDKVNNYIQENMNV